MITIEVFLALIFSLIVGYLVYRYFRKIEIEQERTIKQRAVDLAIRELELRQNKKIKRFKHRPPLPKIYRKADRIPIDTISKLEMNNQYGKTAENITISKSWCSACDSEVQTDDTFCMSCGTKTQNIVKPLRAVMEKRMEDEEKKEEIKGLIKEIHSLRSEIDDLRNAPAPVQINNNGTPYIVPNFNFKQERKFYLNERDIKEIDLQYGNIYVSKLIKVILKPSVLDPLRMSRTKENADWKNDLDIMMKWSVNGMDILSFRLSALTTEIPFIFSFNNDMHSQTIHFDNRGKDSFEGEIEIYGDKAPEHDNRIQLNKKRRYGY